MSLFTGAPSPYIANPKRLADLIAAIQVLGTYSFASRHIEKWEGRLGRTPVSAPDWRSVFLQHPEFFTSQGDSISLVWRRSRKRNFDTQIEQSVGPEELERLEREEEETGSKRLSRRPLDTSEVAKLVEIAISLHEREIKHAQERRWWITAVFALLGLLMSLAGR